METHLPPLQDGDRLRLEALLADLRATRGALFHCDIQLNDLPAGRMHLLSPALKARLIAENQIVETQVRAALHALDRFARQIAAILPPPPPGAQPARAAPQLHVVGR